MKEKWVKFETISWKISAHNLKTNLLNVIRYTYTFVSEYQYRFTFVQILENLSI